jgi:hypothetical protein
MWPTTGHFVVSRLLLELAGHKASQELLYEAEGGPVGRLLALTGPGLRNSCMWLKAGRWVGSRLLLVLGGQMTAEELLYVAEGGPVGRLPALTGPGWPDDG